MVNLLWQSRSPVIYDSLKMGEIVNASNGGNSYDFHAVQILASRFNVSVDPFTIKKPGENLAAYWFRMRSHKPQPDVLIMEPFPLVFGKRSASSRSIAMIHHIDEALFNSSIKHRWFFQTLKNKLQRVDLVVTVSRYWKDYLENAGCKNVKVIYNSFDPALYIADAAAVKNFKARFGLDDGRPLLYLGSASRQKGVYEAYQGVKDGNFNLVMTGSENKAPDLPVQFLNLNRPDYLLLLHASDAVITFSKLVEGWNRIAHEAMLCGTPVIGSGTGGMRELLEGGQQFIVDRPENLLAAVETVFQNKTGTGKAGLAFASKFDEFYFKREWIQTIESLIRN